MGKREEDCDGVREKRKEDCGGREIFCGIPVMKSMRENKSKNGRVQKVRAR